MYFSFYRGSQKYWGCLPGVKDPQSIEGNVEIALGLIRKKYISNLSFSSRLVLCKILIIM